MRRILIVDDDKNIVKALSIRLIEEGYEVFAAYDGPSAVEAAKWEKPSLIVMDISLPFFNGMRAAKQIRDATGATDTPVIFITASKIPGLRAQAEALGAAGFFEKPYEANDLLACVRKALTQPVKT